MSNILIDNLYLKHVRTLRIMRVDGSVVQTFSMNEIDGVAGSDWEKGDGKRLLIRFTKILFFALLFL